MAETTLRSPHPFSQRTFRRLGEEIAARSRQGWRRLASSRRDGRAFRAEHLVRPRLIVESLRPLSRHTIDVHLMIAPVDPYLEAFAKAGADSVTVHAEVGPHLDRSLQAIRALGKRAGVAINPATPEGAIQYELRQARSHPRHDGQPRLRRSKLHPGHDREDSSCEGDGRRASRSTSRSMAALAQTTRAPWSRPGPIFLSRAPLSSKAARWKAYRAEIRRYAGSRLGRAGPTQVTALRASYRPGRIA